MKTKKPGFKSKSTIFKTATLSKLLNFKNPTERLKRLNDTPYENLQKLKCYTNITITRRGK